MSFPAATALLVGHENVFRTEGGGVQHCLREFTACLEATGLALRRVPFTFDKSLASRLVSRVAPRVAVTPLPAKLPSRIARELSESGAGHVFFAMNAWPELSRALRRGHPHVRQVLLSQGLESLDFCVAQQIRSDGGSAPSSSAARMLGLQLLEEAEQRRALDGVVTLSPLDYEAEKWLGARRAMWFPRTVVPAPLEALPVEGRVGCVATLDHPPNADGLRRLMDALSQRGGGGLRFRLAGGPRPAGEALAAAFPFLDYLGPLADAELRREAATWCCFVNPVFAYGKGATMKLAVALGWGIPIATTAHGTRGYRWDPRIVPCAHTPDELAALIWERSTRAGFEEHCRAAQALARLAPSIAEVARELRAFLDSLHGGSGAEPQGHDDP